MFNAYTIGVRMCTYLVQFSKHQHSNDVKFSFAREFFRSYIYMVKRSLSHHNNIQAETF